MNWEIFDRFYNAHWFLTGYSSRNFSELLRDGSHKTIRGFVGAMENDVNMMIFDQDQFNQAANILADKVINNHRWRTNQYKKHTKYTKLFFKSGERFRKLNFSQMTEKELLSEIKKMIPLQEQVRLLGTILNGLVLDGRNHMSNMLQQELREFIGDDKTFNDYWSLLTQVTKLSVRQKKDIEIAKLAAQIKKQSGLDPNQRLKKIHEKYCWLDYMYYGPPASFADYQTELKEAVKHNVNLNLAARLKKLTVKQKALMKRLKFNSRAKHIVRVARFILWQKGWRKDVEYHGFYCYEPFFRELAKRKKIKDWRDILYLLPWELEGFIKNSTPYPANLKERRKFSCLVVKDSRTVKMLIGKQAREYYKRLGLKSVDKNITETQGQCAFVGKAKGSVKIIQVPSDMKKMKQGDILVSQATSPDLLPAMKKAAAIVTSTGGLIAHAAITSRELKIPCVVGTGNATLIFKDGDKVEVNATQGTIRKIK